MTDTHKPVFRLHIAVQWGDMDALGHVNNAAYFNYMQEARIQWLDQLDFDWYGATTPVIVNAFCEYQREVVYPAELAVQVAVGAVGRSSIQTHYTICNLAKNDEVAAIGSSKIVWIDKQLRRSVELPDLVRSAISGP